MTKKKKERKVYSWETILMAEWWSKGGNRDIAISLLLDGIKGSKVITGGRPQWAPPQRSAASLRLILGGKYLSKAEIIERIKSGRPLS